MDIDSAKPKNEDERLNPDAKVVIVQNLTRNVVEAHLQTIFSFYGTINKIDLPTFAKSGQNRGKAAVEFTEPAFAHKAYTHMNGGQLDGAVLKLELSDLPPLTLAPPRPARRPLRAPTPTAGEGRIPAVAWPQALHVALVLALAIAGEAGPGAAAEEAVAELYARGAREGKDAVEEHGAVVALAVVLVFAQPQPIAEQELLKVVQLFEEQES
ncbi:hypothetical protein K523DRAFT_370058 [Schizophyllum commune Tattone D]|nr:hypothetical protein K523DRAFT_370058 [Schizophyllum commune Tattone D]